MNSEIEYLSELINDFPTAPKIKTEDAFNLLRDRYLLLEANRGVFLETLNSKEINKFSSSILSPEGDNFPLIFNRIIFSVHKFLFGGILNNAGQLRKSTDPNCGQVGFGGQHQRIIGQQNFYGTSPENIEKELIDGCLILRKEVKDPIASSLEFYQKFVRVHPFYDANGRIGRFIMNLYLAYFSKSMIWAEITNGNKFNKFIKKLNECHKRENSELYPQYFGYLYNFVKPMVKDINLTQESGTD